MIKLLMTSVGCWVTQNLLDVIDARGDDFCVVGTTSLATITLERADRVYLVPESERPPSPFCERLLEIIDREQPDLVIPTRDQDVTVVSALAAEYPALAELVPCGAPEVALLIQDKWLAYLFAREHGLLFAESAIGDASSSHRTAYELAEAVGFPLIVKLRRGFGSRGVRLVTNKEQLGVVLAQEDVVVQRYVGNAAVVEEFPREVARRGVPLFYTLEQDKFSLQTYVRRDGTVGPVCRTLHRMCRGHSAEVAGIPDDDLATRDKHWTEGLTATGRRWAETLAAAGWRGPVNVQCQRDAGGQYVAFELSGRFTGATAARYFLGHDELGHFLHDRLGQPRGQIKRVVDSLAIKYQRTLGVSQAAVETLSRDGVWDREAIRRMR
jgi:carbamoyl-phosphate synthase large subunit